ncbi:hypothetical protein E2C01_094225 [Portunus trituberculatus]|uniref:Uncharacterized protein n=1 Tax=Portunus trituberculatus TaxID=210409 RepID=A0A5B7JPV5_PORTR|nr:hypothetical protein [Portunus trituberculatus]
MTRLVCLGCVTPPNPILHPQCSHFSNPPISLSPPSSSTHFPMTRMTLIAPRRTDQCVSKLPYP